MVKIAKGLVTILITLIMTTLLVSTVNIGFSIFLERPDYDDYCTSNKLVNSADSCYDDYQDAVDNYNQLKFYIFLVMGILFVLTGLFITLSYITWTGLLTGLIFIGQGIVYNLKNKVAVFIALIITTLLIGYGSWRALKKFT